MDIEDSNQLIALRPLAFKVLDLCELDGKAILPRIELDYPSLIRARQTWLVVQPC